MRIYLSCFFMIAALAFSMTCAPGLEPTAPGVASVLACCGLLVSVGWGKRLPFMCVALVAVAAGYAAWRMVNSPVEDFARSDGQLLICGVCTLWWSAQTGRHMVFRWFIGAVLLLALANVGVGIWQWKVDPRFMALFANRKADAFPCGFYGHYNHFANYLLAAGLLAAGLVLSPERKRWLRWLLALVAVLCGYGVIISQSRGAYLAMAVGMVALLVGWVIDLRRRQVRWMPVIAIAAFLAVPAFIGVAWKVAPELLAERVQGAEAAHETLLEDCGRMGMASMAIKVAQEHPWLGSGSRAYGYELLRFWDPREMWTHSGDPLFVHNEWLQVLVDYGVVGLVMVCLVWLVMWMRGLLVLALESAGELPSAGMTLGALAAILAVTVQSMFSFVFHVAADVLVCGAMLGCLAAQPWPFAKREVKGEAKPHSPILISACLFQISAFLLAATGIWLGWRDVPAWVVNARPDIAGTPRSSERRYSDVMAALHWRNDFRLQQQAGRAALDVSRKSPDDWTHWLEESARHYAIAVERHPKDYLSQLAYGMVLDEMGKVEEAGPHYRQLLPLMDTREVHYHVRYYYALHCKRFGEALWRKRQAEDGMAWLMEALRQIELTAKTGWYEPASKVAEDLKGKIEFLKGAHIEPKTEVVVPVPDPKL